MILRIDPTSSIPIYAQIVDQIKRAIASGVLKAGESLVSLRGLAIALRINPLTVARAYAQLEQEGLIETKHGHGSFVTSQAHVATDGFRREMLIHTIDNLLIDAVHFGVSFEELSNLFEERMKETKNDH